MNSKLLKPSIILVCIDLDGTIFKTNQFMKSFFKLISNQKVEILRHGIQNNREKTGSSANFQIMNIINDEINDINKKINRHNYIYDDVEKYINIPHCGKYLIKHIILTHGEESFQKFKINDTFLENLPIEVRSSNDKIDYINSILGSQNKYCYKSPNSQEEFVADWCFLVDDKITSFEDKKNSFQTVKNLPNFRGFLIERQNEHNHNKDKKIPDFINQVSTLNQVSNYIKNM